jgi:hypothetical protein
VLWCKLQRFHAFHSLWPGQMQPRWLLLGSLCSLPMAFPVHIVHLPSNWSPRVHDSSGSLSQLHTLTSQWLLPQTLALLSTAWLSMISFEILMEASMTPCFLHSADLNTIILQTMPKPANYLYVQPGSTWALVSAASECLDGSL